MDETNQPLSLRDRIEQKIQSGEARMRPRWHFIFASLLVACGIGLITLSAIYLVSFVVFITHATGTAFLPQFGFWGIGKLLLAIPWVLIFIALGFVIALEVLVRRFAFAYRRPLLYSVAAIVLAVLLGSMLVGRTALHARLAERAWMGNLPLAGPLYRGFELERGENAHTGVIEMFIPEGFRMEDRSGDAVKVFVLPETRMPRGVLLKEGDAVFVLGPREQDIIRALGVRPMGPEKPFGPGKRMRMK
ncbi:MAG: hypothetical protein AAB463_00080 [Patescibacteria group bacterium]